VNGAEVLLKTAASAGVDVCFANAGTTERPIVVAFDEMPTIRPILGLFEGVCTGAADGYGRMKNKPAMTCYILDPVSAMALQTCIMRGAHIARFLMWWVTMPPGIFLRMLL